MIKAFMQMSLSGIIVGILGMFMTPVLSRVYSPDSFGLFALFCSITSYFSIVSSFRFEYAFFINKKHIDIYFFICIIIIIVSSVITSLFLPVIFNVNISSILLFLGLLFSSFYNILTQFSVALSKYKEISVARILLGFIQYVSAIIFGVYFYDNGLLYAIITAQLVVSIYLYRKKNILYTGISIKKICPIVKSNMKYCLNSTISSALQWATPLAPVFIGNFIYEEGTIGTYFLLAQSFGAIFSIPRRSLINIYTSEFNTIKNFRTNYDKVFMLLKQKKILLSLIFLSFSIICVFLYLYGVNIIGFVLGNSWILGGKYVFALFLFYSLEVLLFPFVHLLNLWGKYIDVLCIEITRFFSLIILLPYCMNYFDSPFYIYIFIHLFAMFIFNVIVFYRIIHYSKL